MMRSRQAKREQLANDLSERLVTIDEPNSISSEAYRTLRTNLLYSVVDDPPRVVVFTSAAPREGKSTTAANLGVVLAQADQRVLVVDCDLRRPVVHKIFGLRNVNGVVNVIAEHSNLEDVWQDSLAGLKVVTTGPIPPNPAELLGSQRFAEFLASAREKFDYVLLDAPPVELVSDAAILASQSDGVLLVLDSQSTRKNALRHAVHSIETVGGRVLGTVMNNTRTARRGYYGYGGYVYTSAGR